MTIKSLIKSHHKCKRSRNCTIIVTVITVGIIIVTAVLAALHATGNLANNADPTHSPNPEQKFATNFATCHQRYENY